MKKSFIVSACSFLTFLLLPSIVSAEATIAGATTGVTNLSSLVTTITTSLVAALGTLLLAAGVVAFFWGVVQYIWGVREGDGTKIKNGNQFMLWAVIALFVMFSVYGIIQVAQSLIPGLNATTIKIPRFDFQTGQGEGTNAGNGGGLPVGTGAGNGGDANYSNEGRNAGSSAGNGANTNYSNEGRNSSVGSSATINNNGINASGMTQSDILSAYIKNCRAKDPNKSGTQCWQEYNDITNGGTSAGNGGATISCPDGRHSDGVRCIDDSSPTP